MTWLRDFGRCFPEPASADSRFFGPKRKLAGNHSNRARGCTPNCGTSRSVRVRLSWSRMSAPCPLSDRQSSQNRPDRHVRCLFASAALAKLVHHPSSGVDPGACADPRSALSAFDGGGVERSFASSPQLLIDDRSETRGQSLAILVFDREHPVEHVPRVRLIEAFLNDGDGFAFFGGGQEFAPERSFVAGDHPVHGLAAMATSAVVLHDPKADPQAHHLK